jgi:hypothetical protein
MTTFPHFSISTCFWWLCKTPCVFYLKRMPAPDKSRGQLFRCGHLFKRGTALPPRNYKIGQRQRLSPSDSKNFDVACGTQQRESPTLSCATRTMVLLISFASLMTTQTITSST